MVSGKISNKTIGIVVPAYNEESVIGKILDQIPAEMSVGSQKLSIKTIVVNDGSTDKTATKVKGNKGIILINHLINSGVGAATRTGIHLARDAHCDYVITMDSDGQHSFSDVKKLASAIISNEADLIIGSRLIAPGGNMPRRKRLGNLGLGIITFLLLGVHASDTQSGLKALNRKAIENIEFHANDYSFCSELIWRAHRAKLRIKEIPVSAIYTDYSVSRGQKDFTGAINITKQLIKRRFMDFIHG